METLRVNKAQLKTGKGLFALEPIFRMILLLRLVKDDLCSR